MVDDFQKLIVGILVITLSLLFKINNLTLRKKFNSFIMRLIYFSSR